MALSQTIKEEIVKTYLKNASKGQIETYLQFLDEYDLNPYMNHVIFMERSVKDKRTGGYKTLVDLYITHKGLLHIAHRSGKLDGIEHEYVYDDKGNVVAITAMVFRKDMNHPIKARASMKEYNTGRNAWKEFPETMLEVRAEAKALRKAFDIGINAIEEMERVIEEEETTTVEETAVSIDDELRDMLKTIYKQSATKPRNKSWYNIFSVVATGKRWKDMTDEDKVKVKELLEAVVKAFNEGVFGDVNTLTEEDLKVLISGEDTPADETEDDEDIL
jgi:uncharacterized protein (UPF0297 family)